MSSANILVHGGDPCLSSFVSLPITAPNKKGPIADLWRSPTSTLNSSATTTEDLTTGLTAFVHAGGVSSQWWHTVILGRVILRSDTQISEWGALASVAEHCVSDGHKLIWKFEPMICHALKWNRLKEWYAKSWICFFSHCSYAGTGKLRQ